MINSKFVRPAAQRWTALSVLFAGVLAACGGGGGEPTPTTGAPAILAGAGANTLAPPTQVAAKPINAPLPAAMPRPAPLPRPDAETVSPPVPDLASLMPTVNTALIPVGSAGSSVERVNATSERPGSSDGTGAFRTVCDFSHMLFDDPIVYPGQPGRSHLHAFFGNTGVNGNATANSIATTGSSTCRGGILNRSSYWVPAMIDTRDSRPIRPLSSNFYYKTGYYGVAPSTVQSIPPGLRMIAGDPKNAAPGAQYERMPFDYTCGASPKSSSIPNCPVGSEVTQHIYFPQCWDGVNLDSPDHKSHMAYPTGGCPASHPVPLPEITFNIHYAVTEANSTSRWRLSSDNYSSSLPGGYSAHADWFDGWRPDVMDAFVRNCDRPALDCRSHLLGDGRAIY